MGGEQNGDAGAAEALHLDGGAGTHKGVATIQGVIEEHDVGRSHHERAARRQVAPAGTALDHAGNRNVDTRRNPEQSGDSGATFSNEAGHRARLSGRGKLV